MPVRWSAEMDQRLLLLIISMISINWTRVATHWAEVYGQQDGPQPTKKAIIEHIAKLRKMINGGNASPGKTTAGPSSSFASLASGSSTPKLKVQKKTPASSSKTKGKGKQKAVRSDSDSDDSEIGQKPEKEVKKEETESADQEKPLFGEIEPSFRVSLPRTARPAPGRFMTDYAASLDSDFIMADVYDSDVDTMQNTPIGSPAPAPKTSTFSAFAGDLVPSTQNTPAAMPTPAPRFREAHNDEDDCIVVGSSSKKGKGRK